MTDIYTEIIPILILADRLQDREQKGLEYYLNLAKAIHEKLEEMKDNG